MKIHSLFTSLQGEGLFAGVPSFFIRTSGCNLACPYCDAKEAASGIAVTGMSVEEISAEIERAGIYDVCVTGGEPLVQENEVLELFGCLAGTHRIVLETNGTLPVDTVRSLYPEVWVSADYKMPSAGNAFFDESILPVIRGRGWIKCVVASPDDLGMLDHVIRMCCQEGIPCLVSPVIDQGMEWASEVAMYIKENGCRGIVRLQLQLHKILGIA